MLGFADIERAAHKAGADAGPGDWRIVSLDVADFLTGGLPAQLAKLDVVYANCGPLAALLFELRAAHRLDFRIVREVRTLGWVGYAFQEFVARELERPGDVCAHVSNYCRDVWAPLGTARRAVQHYPLLNSHRRARPHSPPPAADGVRCGFFSRVSGDKGFQFVPDIIRRMRDAGWAIAALDMCGSDADGGAFTRRTGAEIEKLGVAVDYLGELDYRRTIRTMNAVDIVLFPSISSIESLGRVIVEAAARGKMIVASDYCGAHDILPAANLIPLSIAGEVSGDSPDAFPIGTLDLDNWTPPRPEDAQPARYEDFVYSRDKFLDVLASGEAEDTGKVTGGALAMAFDWEALAQRSARDWCAGVARRLESEAGSRADLLDLGGAMKRAMIAEGFAPEVTFSRRR